MNGVGLAAPQVGISKRVIVLDVGDGEPFALVNPVLVKGTGEYDDQEGCLSVPGVYCRREALQEGAREGPQREGPRRRVEATGLLARALQHLD